MIRTVLAGTVLPSVRLLPIVITVLFGCKPSPPTDTKIEKGRAIIEQLMNEQHIVGLSITVVREGEMVWSEGFGYSNLESQTKVDPGKTMFRIGSVSKPITAIAAAKLYEEGKLNLDADIRTYLPYFPQKKHPITVRHLASHTSGIRHYNGDPREYFNKNRFKSVKESLTLFQHDSLLFKPGEQFRYSSFGYNTLSAVIEGASSRNYHRYLKTKLFDPLRMNHTIPDYSDSIIVGRSGHYEFDTVSNTIINAEFVDNSYKWAGGGFLSTSEDLARLAWAFHNHQIVSDTTQQLFTSRQQLNNGEYTNYGLGWSIYDDLSVASYGHGGTAVGGKGTIRIFPEQNMVITVATNNWKVNYRDELDEIVKIFVLEKY